MPVQDFVAAKLADEGRKSNGDSRVKASQFPSERWHAQGERGGRFSGRGVFTVGHTPSHSPLHRESHRTEGNALCYVTARRDALSFTQSVTALGRREVAVTASEKSPQRMKRSGR